MTRTSDQESAVTHRSYTPVVRRPPACVAFTCFTCAAFTCFTCAASTRHKVDSPTERRHHGPTSTQCANTSRTSNRLPLQLNWDGTVPTVRTSVSTSQMRRLTSSSLHFPAPRYSAPPAEPGVEAGPTGGGSDGRHRRRPRALPWWLFEHVFE